MQLTLRYSISPCGLVCFLLYEIFGLVGIFASSSMYKVFPGKSNKYSVHVELATHIVLHMVYLCHVP